MSDQTDGSIKVSQKEKASQLYNAGEIYCGLRHQK